MICMSFAMGRPHAKDMQHFSTSSLRQLFEKNSMHRFEQSHWSQSLSPHPPLYRAQQAHKTTYEEYLLLLVNTI
jgi:hypothetical protein